MNENIKIQPSNSREHFARQRINALLAKAVENPLVIVSAGTGYGKTRAVYDFVNESEAPAVWMQLSQSDNNTSCFWNNFTELIGHIEETAAEEYVELGFPDTESKLDQYIVIHKHIIPEHKYLLIFDDVHIIKNPDVIRFLERMINDVEKNIPVILICRAIPQIYIMSLQTKGLVFNISEEDLKLTELEIAGYFRQQGLEVSPNCLREISHDTDGWALSVHLVAQSLRNSPGYSGYVRNAMKQNIFELMEAEVWNVGSIAMKRFLVRLSLIKHLSAELVAILIGDDISLQNEFKQQSAYIRYDKYINAYVIHRLLLDFLHTKMYCLTDDEKCETYKTAAWWCRQNGFIRDSLGYYEKNKDYESIVSIFADFYSHIPGNLALYTIDIIKRAPQETFDRVDFFAALHLSVLFSLGRWEELFAKAEYYEQKFLSLPTDNALRNHTLIYIYYFSGTARMLISNTDNRYDFDVYFSKMAECLTNPSTERFRNSIIPLGPWANLASSSEQNAPQRYIDALTRATQSISHQIKGITGYDDLCKGELLFYQGDIHASEFLIAQALSSAAANKQFDIMHRALLYIMRIAVLQGKRKKAEQALKDIAAGLDEKKYASRFVTYDIALGWYYYLLRCPQLVPDWLKCDFAPYANAFFIENFGNQLKARYHYLTKNFPPLLSYISEMKQRESALFGRVEMLAIEACAFYQAGDKTGAFTVLGEAYKTASENNIIMPFIELGKDMRTLTSAIIRNTYGAIPNQWLKTINQKSSIYAKYQSLVIADYKKENDSDNTVTLSNRETKVLRDLYNGLSRTEIAVNQELSINTIKMIINSIFEKLCANNIVDAIRITAERKLM